MSRDIKEVAVVISNRTRTFVSWLPFQVCSPQWHIFKCFLESWINSMDLELTCVPQSRPQENTELPHWWIVGVACFQLFEQNHSNSWLRWGMNDYIHVCLVRKWLESRKFLQRCPPPSPWLLRDHKSEDSMFSSLPFCLYEPHGPRLAIPIPGTWENVNA